MLRLLENIAIAAFLCLIAPEAFAHTGQHDGTGFAAGFFHPIKGLDHFLAMFSVGLISTKLGGRAVWTVPATFVGVMAVGGAMGIAGVALPMIELGIALSIIILGAGIAMKERLPVQLVYAFVAVFAICHGYAHGAEMPSMAQPINYAVGFMTATASIHILGVFFGLGSEKLARGEDWIRLAGAAIAGMGVQFVWEALQF